MWKIRTTHIKERINDLLLSPRLFPEKQKRCRRGSKEISELLYISQYIFNESKTGQKNLAMAWIDNKKAYDMVPPKLENAHDIRRSHKFYVENHENLREIQRGTFQAEALSALLLVIAMMPLNHLIRKWAGGYKLSK